MKKNFYYMGLIRYLLLLIIVLIIFDTTVFAHPGNTDDNGGHYNSETGEYHYHHGYPAHQHINGECPYDFVDKTNDDSVDETNVISDTSSKTDDFFIRRKWLFLFIGIETVIIILLIRIIRTRQESEKSLYEKNTSLERALSRVSQENFSLRSEISNQRWRIQKLEDYDSTDYLFHKYKDIKIFSIPELRNFDLNTFSDPYFAFKIRTDDMYPYINKGDYIIVNPHVSYYPNAIVFFFNELKGPYCRKLIFYQKKYKLISFHNPYRFYSVSPEAFNKDQLWILGIVEDVIKAPGNIHRICQNSN